MIFIRTTLKAVKLMTMFVIRNQRQNLTLLVYFSYTSLTMIIIRTTRKAVTLRT